MTQNEQLKDRILDCALELAEQCGWEVLNLYQVAEEMELSLEDIRQHYSQKDDLVEAWFDRADQAVLNSQAVTALAELPPRERVHVVIMQWLQALQVHRGITRQMLCYKLEFGHIHLQVLGLLRISRTVQWFREAAMLRSTHLTRIAEEVCLSGIYVSSFVRWLFDETEDSRSTDRYLTRALKHVRSLNS